MSADNKVIDNLNLVIQNLEKVIPKVRELGTQEFLNTYHKASDQKESVELIVKHKQFITDHLSRISVELNIKKDNISSLIDMLNDWEIFRYSQH